MFDIEKWENGHRICQSEKNGIILSAGNIRLLSDPDHWQFYLFLWGFIWFINTYDRSVRFVYTLMEINPIVVFNISLI
jgi:hypothetical protein